MTNPSPSVEDMQRTLNGISVCIGRIHETRDHRQRIALELAKADMEYHEAIREGLRIGVLIERITDITGLTRYAINKIRSRRV